MYDIFTYIWLIFMANVGKYTIHGSVMGIARTVSMHNKSKHHSSPQISTSSRWLLHSCKTTPPSGATPWTVTSWTCSSVVLTVHLQPPVRVVGFGYVVWVPRWRRLQICSPPKRFFPENEGLEYKTHAIEKENHFRNTAIFSFHVDFQNGAMHLRQKKPGKPWGIETGKYAER